jgi:hypothetical protein
LASSETCFASTNYNACPGQTPDAPLALARTNQGTAHMIA